MPEGLCGFDKTIARGWFEVVYTRNLKLTVREGGLVIYHGFMLKVEMESDERFHSVLIGYIVRIRRIEAYFSQKRWVIHGSESSPVVWWILKLMIDRWSSVVLCGGGWVVWVCGPGDSTGVAEPRRSNSGMVWGKDVTWRRVRAPVVIHVVRQMWIWLRWLQSMVKFFQVSARRSRKSGDVEFT